ncbi:MAG TPA: EAL domain-containing protein [Kineosporiaceae bacterium]
MASTRVTDSSWAPPGAAAAGVPLQPGRWRTARAAADVPPPAAVPVEVAVPAGVPVLWRWDAVSGRVDHSARVPEALGLLPGTELSLVAVRRLVHPDDLERFDDLVLGLVTRRIAVQGTIRFAAPDGVRTVHAWAGIRVEEGRVAGAFGGLLDVTGFGPELEALHGSLVALRAAEELTGLGLWEWDPASGELLWTAPMYSLVGVAPGAVQPTLARWHEAVHPADRERALNLDVGALDRSGGHVETLRVVGADGVVRYVRCWSTAVGGPGGVQVHGAAVEVSRQVRDQARLEWMSATDVLTGLLNRHGLEQRLRHQLATAARADGDVVLVLLDLDRFKAVNDTLGHHVGDALLVEVSRRLARVVPQGSVIARMGGDEFAVLPPPGPDGAQLGPLGQAVVEALRAPYALSGAPELVACPVSAGVTSRRGRGVGAHELLAEADLALYQAKDTGRGRYVIFDDGLLARARARHLAERLLRSALDGDRLALWYQPIIDLPTGRRVGAEALVRLRDLPGLGGRPAAGGDGVPGERLLLPEAFIDVAEDTGLVVELDCWVIDHALEQLSRWSRRRGPAVTAGVRIPDPPWLAVNVSARTMQQPGVVRRILDGLARHRIPPRLLKLELTERSFLGADPAGESALRQLIGSGVPVGIDDFGTGYSALAYLQRFELDFMKIDRSFVASVGEQGRADAVVTAIVDLAHAHGMRVTAEGIEHAHQADRLREIGCDLAQGYHFGRPTPGWT